MNPDVAGTPACASRKNASRPPSTGRRSARPLVVVEGVVVVTSTAGDREDREGADRHERVREQVEQRGLTATRCRDLEPDEDVARVRDRGVREHAFDVGLDHGRDAADGEREHRERPHRRAPVLPVEREREREHPDQGGEARGLRRRRHERGHRRGRALVDVRRPHVERHGGDLEPQPDEQQREARQQRPLLEQRVVGQEGADAGQRGGARGAVRRGRCRRGRSPTRTRRGRST